MLCGKVKFTERFPQKTPVIKKLDTRLLNAFGGDTVMYHLFHLKKPHKFERLLHPVNSRSPWSGESYRKTSNIRRTLVGNKIVDHCDVVGASPVGAAPTTSSFST